MLNTLTVSQTLHFTPENEIDLTALNAYEDEDDNIVVDFDSLSKAELQKYADERNISGVNSSRQTKAQMIAVIEEAIYG